MKSRIVEVKKQSDSNGGEKKQGHCQQTSKQAAEHKASEADIKIKLEGQSPTLGDDHR
jgi:hypothetical protein